MDHQTAGPPVPTASLSYIPQLNPSHKGRTLPELVDVERCPSDTSPGRWTGPPPPTPLIKVPLLLLAPGPATWQVEEVIK